MDTNYLKGELLQVHTKNSEIFEGRFYSITKDKSKISLYNVKELPEGIENEGVCHYYNSEVTDIVKLADPNPTLCLKITQKECENIIVMCKKYCYINQVDSTFHKAMADLNSYRYIGISTDGANMGRKCKMPFLVLSTPSQIYIFDIHTMDYHAFDAGLQKMLEGDHPKKIVHDCRKLSDCLYHKHHIKLNSIFDTQVGDLIITKNKEGHLPLKVKSLSECLCYYIGLDLKTIDDKLDIVQCTQRPLSVDIKEALAKNIGYLHRLSDFIHEQLVLPFVRGVECYVESLRSCDDFKAWELCGKLDQLPNDFKIAIDY